MNLEKFSLIDIKVSKEYEHLLSQIENDATCSGHRNAKNYINIRNSLDSFLSYEILIDKDNNIIASSGLQQYSDNQSRVASRTYIMSTYRKIGGSTLPLSEDIFVPYEIEVAKKYNQRVVFFSIELLRRRNAVIRFCKNLNKKNLRFELHQDMINTCRKYKNNGIDTINEEQSCWQNIGYLSIDGSNITLPRISIAEYQSKYYTSELKRLMSC